VITSNVPAVFDGTVMDAVVKLPVPVTRALFAFNCGSTATNHGLASLKTWPEP